MASMEYGLSLRRRLLFELKKNHRPFLRKMLSSRSVFTLFEVRLLVFPIRPGVTNFQKSNADSRQTIVFFCLW